MSLTCRPAGPPRNPYKEGFRKHRVTCLKSSGWFDILTPARSVRYAGGHLAIWHARGRSHAISASQVVKHEIVELFQRLADGTCKSSVKAGPSAGLAGLEW